MLLCLPVTDIDFLIYLHSNVAGTGMETKEGDHTQQPLVILCANCERDAEISAAAASAKVEGLQLFEVCVSLCSKCTGVQGEGCTSHCMQHASARQREDFNIPCLCPPFSCVLAPLNQ